MIETLGTFLRERRDLLGLTQKEVADQLELNPAYLSQIERGRVALPSAMVRRRLADILGVRHIDLLVAAGELDPEEVPGPSSPLRDPANPHLQLAAKLQKTDLSVDNRAATLTVMLELWRQQDVARRTQPGDHANGT